MFSVPALSEVIALSHHRMMALFSVCPTPKKAAFKEGRVNSYVREVQTGLSLQTLGSVAKFALA